MNGRCDNCKEWREDKDLKVFTDGDGILILCPICSPNHGSGEA